MIGRNLPRATYRLQLHGGLGFDRAAGLTDYLSALGVSHVYASPYFTAVRGSTHGYDVVDPTRVDPELGGEDAHARLLRALRDAGLGQVLDVVPNHMAAAPSNPWWWDVLENGLASERASFFDIDWDPPEARLKGVVLLPVLRDHYGRVLERRELALERADGVFRIRYGEHLWPLSPESLGAFLEPVAASSGSAALATTVTGLRELPASSDPQVRTRRARQLNSLRRSLEWTLDEQPDTAAAVDRAIAALNDDPDALDRLLEQQHYRAAHWRARAQDLDYRRFFDVDTLVGVRVEEPDVFAFTHARVRAWLRDGLLDGLRVDHPDGLRRPREYLDRLRELAPSAWIVVEKILMPGECLPADWPVDGTTGYDFLNDVGGLFVDPAGEGALTQLYYEVTRDSRGWREVADGCRREVVDELLGSDVERLAHWGVRVCEGRRRYRDFTRAEIRAALAETLICFPVYRSYVDELGRVSDRDREVIGETIAEARERRSDLASELFDLIEAVLAGGANEPPERELRMRFQQLTGPVMAKAVEDSAFYRYVRFVMLNEVGGSPARFGVSPAAFHERRTRAAEGSHASMLALSTHDTKRGEDVRARLALLSEIPERWGAAVRRWRAHNAVHRRVADWPDPASEYLLYQTLVGAWPISVERAVEYMRKAAREARVHTSWTVPDERFEADLEAFVRGALGDRGFTDDLAELVAHLTGPGHVNALAQKAIQLTAPGVPDLYQGSELWDRSLVDPDNRRPVDWALRRRILDALERAHTAEGPAGAARVARVYTAEGGPKLWLVRQALRLRCEERAAFAPGSLYRPLAATGAAAEHLMAFARGGQVITVAPRLVLGLGRRGGWGDTALDLPEGAWCDRLTGARWSGRVAVDELLRGFPVGLLVRE
jgi:(1->4)-alpha-D-glucan 1-alpha-D-glucosylmutase